MIEKLPKQEHTPHKKEEESISYLGVAVERGAGGPLTPDTERFKDDVITDFDLEVMKKIAVGLKLGQPVLLEGGSGLGKTRTVDRMCAELNREFYIANCHKMQIEDLIGSKTTKEDTKSGFGWVDGVITQAVRNGGVLFLDEYNFMPGETRGGIHQIFDALLQGKTHITLPENDNEQVSVHPDFRIIAAQNPPGGEFGDREVLDRAQIDRFLTIKLPEGLPEETRKARLLGALNIDNEITVPEEEYIVNGPGLTNEALRDIPGIEDILQRYLEATKQITIAQKKGEIANRDYQPVAFGTARDDNRILAFIRAFYNGDLNHTMQQALELYYLNKVADQEDREKMKTILERVRYTEEKDTKRRGLEQEIQEETISPEDALEIMGEENYLGPKDIQDTFDFIPENIPEIPFSQAELKRAKELGHHLILYVDTRDGQPFTLEDMIEITNNETSDGNPILYRKEQIQNSKDQIPRPGWRLTSPEVTENTTDKNYLEQTESLITYLQNEVFKDQDLPETYRMAIEEFKNKKETLEDLLESDWEEAAQQLASLTINQLLRENAPEVIYRLILSEKQHDTRNLQETRTWTNSIGSDGALVYVGNFALDGLNVYSWPPDGLDANTGACLSRSAS